MLLLICVSAAVVCPIYFYGIPNGNDLPQHYQFAVTFQDAITDGTLYPHLSSETNLGLGDVGVRFYPPFSYYILAGFHSLSGNWYDGSVLTFFFLFFLSGLGVYLWAKESYSSNAALVAAVCYILAPYHVNQLFNAFTYAEFAAASVLPFCFLFAARVCRRGRASDVLLLGLSYGVLVLTHLPMTVIGSVCLFVFSIASLERDYVKTLLRLGSAGLAGLLLSSFYWLRMATELKFVRHSTDEFSSAAYDFNANFLAAFFHLSSLEYDERSLWFADLTLLITLGLFIPGLVLLFLRWKRPQIFTVRAPIITLCVALFFATPVSLVIWQNVGVLKQTQFPWRWLSIISLMAVFLTAAAYRHVFGAFRTPRRPIAILAVGLVAACIVFTATQVIKPAIYISRSDFSNRVQEASTAASYECWWPVWAKASALSAPSRVDSNGRPNTIEHWGRYSRIVKVSAGAPGAIRLGTFYYPFWQATVNNEAVKTEKAEDGAILIPVGPEESLIEVRFKEPQLVAVANVVSICTLLFILIGIFFVAIHRSISSPRLH